MESSGRSDGWSELERRFFEDAPPDVPLQPPAPPSFEDLVANEPPRRRLTRRTSAERRARPRGPSRRAVGALALARTVLARWAAVVSWAAPKALRARRWAVAKTTRTRRWAVAKAIVAWQWTRSRAAREWRSRAATRLAAREAAARSLRGFVERILDELPSERPDRKTMVAAVAAFVVVLGLSASVLGSRGTWLAFRAPNANAAVRSDLPVAPAAAPTAAERPAPR